MPQPEHPHEAADSGRLETGAPGKRRRIRRLFPGILPLATVAGLMLFAGRVIYNIHSAGEPFFNNDEPRHVMTAVFWYDLLRTMPTDDPVGFTCAYYGHYPAISPLHWPPLLHSVTGAVFLLTGPSVIVARYVVFVATLLMLGAVYKIAARLADRDAAMLAVLLMMGMFAIFRFSSIFMLEIPCMLLVVLCVLSAVIFIDTGKSRYIWACAAAGLAAILTKQHAVILVPTIAALGLIRRKDVRWSSPHIYVSLSVAMLLAGAYYAVVFSNITSSLQDMAVAGGSIRGAMTAVAYYFGVVPVPVAAMALVVVIAGRRLWPAGLCVAWVVAVFLLFASMGVKDVRYLIYACPPIAILGGYFLAGVIRKSGSMGLVSVAVCLVSSVAYWAWAMPERRMEGYEQAARQAAELSSGKRVLFSGAYDGPFVLYRRLMDPQLETITFRASKLLGGGIILPGRGYRGFVDSPLEVMEAIEASGVDIVVAEDRPEMDTPEHLWFWEILNSDNGKFIVVKELSATYPNGETRKITLFRYTGKSRASDMVNIPMLSLSRGSLVVDMRRKLLRWGRKRQ